MQIQQSGSEKENVKMLTYLFRGLCFNKLLVDFLRLRRHPERGLNFLVVLACQPELYILVAEF